MSELPIKIELPEHFLEEEVRWDYTVTGEMKKIWAVELDLLVELLRVCRKYDLQIFGDGGTILGAVRHKGYIPWDDDIDLMMMRDQYDRLCEVAAREFQFPYFFQTEYTDPGSLRGHAQLRNSQTTGIRTIDLDKKYRFNQGIFIDIFPLDAAPDDPKELEQIQNRTSELITKARANARKTTRYYPAKSVIRRPFKKLAHLLLSGRLGDLTGFNSIYDQYETECRRYNGTQTEKVAKYVSTKELKKKQVWKREWFDSAIDLPFEFLSIPVPAGYEEILDLFFGDWRTPLQISSGHGGMIFDTSRSYIQYLGELKERQ